VYASLARVRHRRSRVALPLLGALAVLAVAVATALLLRGGDPPPGVPLVPGEGAALADPFAWTPDRTDAFVRQAASGSAHPLYAHSPGGAEATAARTARWRPLVEDAARAAGVDADTLEGLVFLESAGRPDAVTPAGLEGAAGLTQILAETATNLLGMRVDLAASRRLTRRIDRALRLGHGARAARLTRERARVDGRFDPRAALAGTARYLSLARRRFAREDLAFVSYHMGMGNLEGVLSRYGRRDVSYGQLYFDSTPIRHAGAWRRLFALGDDSANYLWKVLAGRDIMRLWREDPGRLHRLAQLHAAKASAEELLHPPGETPVFEDPIALRAAWDDDAIVAFGDDEAATGLRRDTRMGELARRVRQRPELYRGLRPEALALALYVGAQVRALSGTAPLVVTSTVRDAAYQRVLARRTTEATRRYSLHTTGWAFDVERAYRSRRQAVAFQFVLDRLQVLDAIAWVREPAAIHVTAGPRAKALLPLLERVR
jgi:soluble lytic murein transglycosylase-like protein